MSQSEKGDLTRAEIIDALNELLSISRKDAKAILENFLEIIIKGLEDGETMVLNDVGSFKVAFTPARPGRNPKTGLLAKVPAKKRVAFKISPNLRQAMKKASEEKKELTLGLVDRPPDLAPEAARGFLAPDRSLGFDYPPTGDGESPEDESR